MSLNSGIDLRRRAPTRFPKRAYLILHSPGLEEEYLHWLKRALEHSQIALIPAPEGESSVDSVKRLVRLKREARLQGSTYDEVWCILQPTTDLTDALESAERAGIKIAICDPCFELWLLMHRVAPDDFATAESVKSALLAEFPDIYAAPRKTMELLSGEYPIARSRAIALTGAEVSMVGLVDSIRESLRAFRNAADVDGP